jgi:hypothetical protein
MPTAGASCRSSCCSRALIYFGVNPGSLVERIKPAVAEVVKS